MSTGPTGRPPRYPSDPRAIGEIPGYEFEAPRAATREIRQGALAGSADPLREIRPPAQPPPRKPRSLPVRVAGGALAAMLARNWVAGLAIPVLAAILVGVAAVVVVGGSGGGGAAPSALDAGFPAARAAGTDFTGGTVASPVVLDTIAASAGTEVAAGSADGGPALWVSANGGSTWARAALTGPAALTTASSGELAGVAHGGAGWLACGTALSGTGRSGTAGPVLASSPDGQTWTVSGGATVLPGATGGTVAAAVATGPAGYVIVGHQAPSRTAADGPARAVAWYAPAGAGWRRAVITQPAAASAGRASGGSVSGGSVSGGSVSGSRAGGAQEMSAVTATARGFAAVGGDGAHPAAWLSDGGRTWRLVTLPLPDGASRAAFTAVAASGTAVVAVGTEVSPAGAGSPFAEVSGDSGATWRPTPLPRPAAGAAAITVTALTAAGGGFTAAGSYDGPGGADVVVWTLPSIARTGDGWAAATLPGTGLAGGSATRQPTLWQSPIRS
jgi:hypothetical protein